MDGESGESTKGEDVVGAGKGKSEIRETVVRLMEKTRELKVRHIEKND